MDGLLTSLVPLLLGVALSPLAVVAIIAVLLSHRPGANGSAFLAGWATGIAAVLVFGWLLAWIFAGRSLDEPPVWVPTLRVLVGVELIAAALWVLRRGRKHLRAMAQATGPALVVAAAPQLPGWLHSVETFRPVRSYGLGIGLCALNPVDASCIIVAAVDIAVADVTTSTAAVVSLGFIVIGSSAVATPVLLYAIGRDAADAPLRGMRTWLAGHSSWVNASILAVIGLVQLWKGARALW